MTNAEVRIGAWWSQCCPLDTYQIATEQDVAYVREALADEDIGPSILVWASFGDAWKYWNEGGHEDAEALADLWSRRPPEAK